LHADSHDSRRGDGAPVLQQKLEVFSALDKAGLEYAARHGSGTVLGMSGNTDGAAAEALDPIMPVLGLHFEQGTGRQALAIN